MIHRKTFINKNSFRKKEGSGITEVGCAIISMLCCMAEIESGLQDNLFIMDTRVLYIKMNGKKPGVMVTGNVTANINCEA